MDQLSGQLLLALTCVAVAVAVLVRRFVLMIRNPGKSGCGSGSCGGCPANHHIQANTPQEVIQLQIDKVNR